MTPADEPAFLRPILARPHDDGPRLILADFLDESDDPADRDRGELVRIQCALARLADDHDRRPELVAREAELLHRHHATWAAPLAGLAAGCEFRRGLLDAVSVDAGTFLSRGDDLFRRGPAVRRVRLLDAGRHAHRLANCPPLARVAELDLCGNDLGNGGLNLLLRSPHLGRVEAIDLSFNGLCDGGAGLVARATTLPRLRELVLNDNYQITAAGVNALAESPHRAGLLALDLSGNDVNDAGVKAITDSRFLTKLHTLRLHMTHVGDTGAIVLAGSELLSRMLARRPRLDLRSISLHAPGVQALVASPRVAPLRHLDLSGNFLGDDGLAALAASPHLAGLRTLSVRKNSVSDAGAVRLARSPVMRQLTRLDVSANRITSRGLDELYAHRRSWQTVLEAAGNYVTEGAAGPEKLPPPRPAAAETPAPLDQAVGEVLARIANPRRA